MWFFQNILTDVSHQRGGTFSLLMAISSHVVEDFSTFQYIACEVYTDTFYSTCFSLVNVYYPACIYIQWYHIDTLISQSKVTILTTQQTQFNSKRVDIQKSIIINIWLCCWQRIFDPLESTQWILNLFPESALWLIYWLIMFYWYYSTLRSTHMLKL